MHEQEKMHTGQIYQPADPELMARQLVCQDRLDEYNATSRLDGEKRQRLLKELFAEVGENCYLESPVYANWGGRHVHLGKNIYTNYGVTFVDDTHIYVGDGTMIGPNVILATAGHPIDPELRALGLQYNMPVRIGKNCWLGAGVIVMPGVSIGDNSVIGAGSVVTKDIPANVVAVGNPCRVLRPIGQHDREFYWRDRKVDPSAYRQEAVSPGEFYKK